MVAANITTPTSAHGPVVVESTARLLSLRRHAASRGVARRGPLSAAWRLVTRV